MELNTRIPRDVKKTCFVDEWFQSNKLKKKVVNSLLQGNYCKIFGNTKISNENFLKILKQIILDYCKKETVLMYYSEHTQ